MYRPIENLKNNHVLLERVDHHNVDFLIKITLDRNVQGVYKTVPDMSKTELEELFLKDINRQYFVIRNSDMTSIGRFYYRKWQFDGTNQIDWELNIIIRPEYRGKGYGTAAQKLVMDYLMNFESTNSVFAYTMRNNIGERKALEKSGFLFIGNLSHPYYKINLDHLNTSEFVLYSYMK